MFGNTFKTLCSLPSIQACAPEDGKPPLPPKSFTTPTRATGLTGPQRLLPAPWCPLYISLVQSFSHVQLFAISWGARDGQVSLSIINSQRFLRLMFIRSVMPPNNFIFCLPDLPSAFNLSLHQGLFSWVSSWHQLAKVLEVQLQHQSSQWIFRTYFF